MKQHGKFKVVILLMPALLLSVFMYCNSYYFEKTKPEIKNGLLDLKNWGKNKFASFQLSGEWQMYPGLFSNAGDALKEHKNGSIIKLPFSTKKTVMNDVSMTVLDAATFRIHVINSPTGSNLGIGFDR